MTVMLFPDPRMRSPTALGDESPVLVEAVDDAFFTLQGGRRIRPVPAYGDFGLTYACDEVRAALNELEPLLAQAKAAKLLTTHWFSADEGHPIAVRAQSLYSQVINQNLVIASDEACASISGDLRAASAPLRELLSYNKTEQVGYTPPAESPFESPDTLDKLKPLFITVGVVAGVVVLAPIVYELIGSLRMLRKSRSRYRGRR